MDYQQWIAALCLWREARGASLPAKHAIWWVILNRSRDKAKRWPQSVAGVITQPAQFSSFSAGDPNVTKFPIPNNGPDWNAFLDCQTAVQTSLGDDPTDGATNYESMPECAPMPHWADPAKITCTIGPFRFYKL
jgi:spore germination cell wall hydrolase CwlJ-like protein